MAQPSSADVDDYDYQPGNHISDFEDENYPHEKWVSYSPPRDPLDLLSKVANEMSCVNSCVNTYLSGTEPFGKSRRPYSRPLKISMASYASPNAIVVDPYCGSRYKRSKARNTSRLRVALQPLAVVGSAARRNAVDPGIYQNEHGPYQNTCEKGLFETKEVTYPGEKKPLKLRVRWTTDKYGNEFDHHIPILKQRSRPRCSKCRQPMKGHGKTCNLAGSLFVEDID